MTVKFWGVRGSFPVPGQRTVAIGGNTSCVEVRAGGHLLIFDAGTGLINFGQDLSKHANGPIVANLFLSHTHHDHTMGFPFFQPAYNPSTRLYMFGPRQFDEDLEDAISNAMLPPFFPVRLREMECMKSIRNIEPQEVVVYSPGKYEPDIRDTTTSTGAPSPEDVRVRCLRSRAHPGGVIIYRVDYQDKALVYATDTEGYVAGDSKLIAFAMGADLLIHDAQYTAEEYSNLGDPRQGYGHSTPDMAIAAAKAGGVKTLALFHHDPFHDDDSVKAIEAEAKRSFPGSLAAYEGLELTL